MALSRVNGGTGGRVATGTVAMSSSPRANSALPLGKPRGDLAIPLGLTTALACLAGSHRQDDTKLGVTADHARVGLGGFCKRIRFNHRTHTAQFGEAQGVLGIDGRSRGPALNALDSDNQLHR